MIPDVSDSRRLAVKSRQYGCPPEDQAIKHGWDERFPHHGRDLVAEYLGGPHEFRVGQRRHAHLEAQARDAAERFAVCAGSFPPTASALTDHQRPGWAAQGVEVGAGGWRPAALFADLGEGVGVAGKEFVRCLFGGVGNVADGVDADLQLFAGMAGALASFVVEIDERAKAVRLAADDRNHERKSERAGAGKRLGRSADAEPDGQRILQRPG